jgi:Tol biopolymer transport system component
VFTSNATNLVASDTNTYRDIFVRDLVLGTTTRVNVDGSGNECNFESDHGVISGYARFVAYQSGGTNLVPGDTNGSRDIFVYDRQTGAVERANLTSTGGQANLYTFFPSISAEGRYIAFDSNANNLVPGDSNGQRDVFLRDRMLGTTSRLSVDPAGGQVATASALPAISDIGAVVAFESAAAVLVPGDTNGVHDVFVRETTFACAGMSVYCTAKTNSLACVPRIGASGAPKAAGFDAFRVTAVNVLSNKNGLMFWGASSGAIPFGGGTLCLQPPLKRTPAQNSGGNPLPTDCSGAYSFHFSQAYMAANSVAPGATLYAQWWSRDPGFAPPNNIGLTDALSFTVCP